jgi:outer membrane protein OmpA-like peptidoglycan-associated protein
MLAACAPKTMVVLVPDDDGQVGQVAVATSTAKVILTGADEYADVTETISSVKHMDQRIKQRLFGAALAAAPQQPVSFLLYFKSDSTVPDQASKDMIPEIVQLIQNKLYPQVSVIGHTDTSGDMAYNNKLSLSRAESVRNMLEQRGVSPSLLKIYAYGENDPLVPTGPDVSEPKNRRVEVFVR